MVRISSPPLHNLRAVHERQFRALEDILRIAFPGFRRLEFPVVGSGQVTLAWYQEDIDGPLFLNELSEGTLRFLWLATVLLSPSPAPITCIDEPEVSLHPELLKLLAGLLQDASMRGQYIVATHSPELIRWLEPKEILILDKEEGRTSFTWADSLDLKEWLAGVHAGSTLADGHSGRATVTVVLLVEGATETALKSHLKRFLDQRANQEGKPKLALRTKPFRTMPTEKELRKRLGLELRDIKSKSRHWIARCLSHFRIGERGQGVHLQSDRGQESTPWKKS